MAEERLTVLPIPDLAAGEHETDRNHQHASRRQADNLVTPPFGEIVRGPDDEEKQPDQRHIGVAIRTRVPPDLN